MVLFIVLPWMPQSAVLSRFVAGFFGVVEDLNLCADFVPVSPYESRFVAAARESRSEPPPLRHALSSSGVQTGTERIHLSHGMPRKSGGIAS
jgi:hypothetical protein